MSTARNNTGSNVGWAESADCASAELKQSRSIGMYEGSGFAF